MPVNIVKKSVRNLPKQQDIKTEFIVLYYIKQLYDSIIILFWPASVLFFFYLLIEDVFMMLKKVYNMLYYVISIH